MSIKEVWYRVSGQQKEYRSGYADGYAFCLYDLKSRHEPDVCKCGIDKGAKVTLVHDYGGACDFCGHPITMKDVPAIYWKDFERDGRTLHAFVCKPYQCEGCGTMSSGLKLYCGPLLASDEALFTKVAQPAAEVTNEP